jgi:hypothetical protein
VSAVRIWAIFAKDAVDALRDARILVALVIPIGLAIFYGSSSARIPVASGHRGGGRRDGARRAVGRQ